MGVMLLRLIRIEVLMKNAKLFLSSITFLLAGFSAASACVCVGSPSVARAVKEAKVVFSGRVIVRGKYGSWFKVERAWKGVTSGTIYIYTGDVEDDCTSLFETTGERWLIYAYLDPLYRSENAQKPYTYKLMTRACDRTTLLANAQEDLKELGLGELPKIKNGRRKIRKR